jgi:hypothetical protein
MLQTVAALVGGFNMNKLPHSMQEVYEERGRLEGYELPLSHLPNRYKT